MIKRVLLYGGGGHAKVVLDCLLDSEAKVVGIFDNTKTGELMGVPYVGDYNASLHAEAGVIVAIGDNQARKRIASTIRHAFDSAIHRSAIVSAFAKTGTGVMILHRAVIQAGSVIGNHVIVNTGAQVDHDCTIGDYVHIAPGAVLCGTVSVGEGTLIGAGATVLPGVRIGAWATIGAGAVVRKDVAEGALVVGNPGRGVRRKN